MRIGIFDSLLMILTVLLGSSELAAQSDFEKPQVMSAQEILPVELQAGKGFKVADRVESNGYWNKYQVHSDFGDYTIERTSALRKLIFEVQMLLELKKFTDTKVFTDAAKEAGIGLVEAPIKGVGKLIDTVSSPDKLVATAKKIPAGIVGLFDFVSDKVQVGYDTVKGLAAKPDKSTAKEAGNKAVEGGSSLLGDYTGYNKRESEWYKKLHLDPYTGNEAVRSRITRIVSIETGVNVGFMFVPGLPALALVGQINHYVGLAERLALYADPQELRDRAAKDLKEMGIADSVSGAFLDNRAYSPIERALIVDALKRLSGVTGKEGYLKEIGDVKKESQASFHTEAIWYLADLYGADQALSSILVVRDLPAAIRKDGTAIAPLAMDRVFWTKEIAGSFRGFLQSVQKRKGVKRIELRFAADLSPLARQCLQQQPAVTIVERVEIERILKLKETTTS